MHRYRMDCPAALHRLVVGVPATVEHSADAGNGDAGEMGKWVAETTQVSSRFSSCCSEYLDSFSCP